MLRPAPIRTLLGLGLLLLLTRVLPLQAQERPADTVWKPIIEHDGLAVDYIFYSEADNANNGVVIKLTNTNAYSIRYRFKIVFRADEMEHVEQVRGDLQAGEAITGDSAGLFWIPFKDQRSINEIGLRGYRVTRNKDAPPTS